MTPNYILFRVLIPNKICSSLLSASYVKVTASLLLPRVRSFSAPSRIRRGLLPPRFSPWPIFYPTKYPRSYETPDPLLPLPRPAWFLSRLVYRLRIAAGALCVTVPRESESVPPNLNESAPARRLLVDLAWFMLSALSDRLFLPPCLFSCRFHSRARSGNASDAVREVYSGGS